MWKFHRCDKYQKKNTFFYKNRFFFIFHIYNSSQFLQLNYFHSLNYSQFDLPLQLKSKLMSQTNNNSYGNAGPSPGCNSSSNGILGSTSNFDDNVTSIVNTTVSSSTEMVFNIIIYIYMIMFEF